MITGEQFSTEYVVGWKKTFRGLLSKRVQYDKAQDITQWAWTRAWEKREQYRGDCLFLTWVNCMAWRKAIMELRHETSVPMQAIPLHIAYRDNLDVYVELQERLRGLRNSDVALLKARHIDNAPVVDMTRDCNMSVSGLKSRLMRARAKAAGA